MCGILGIQASREVEGSEIQKMASCMESRGPDSMGFLCLETDTYLGRCEDDIPDVPWKPARKIKDSDKSSTWFAHTRLSVTGGTASRQPMGYDELRIVFEGEIYNYRKIRKELEKKGYNFRTSGDTEVFLKAFHQWGDSCTRRFDGKWAAAIHNRSKNQTVVLSDYFGTIPVYYIDSEEGVFFASSIRPLLELESYETAENRETRTDYLQYGLADHGRETFFDGVYRLRAQKKMVIESEGKTNIERIELPDQRKNDGVRKAAARSIRTRGREVEAAIPVSGGLDSSIVATVLEGGSQLYSGIVTEESVNEENYLESIEGYIGEQAKRIDLEPSHLLKKVRENIRIQEEPTLILPAQAQELVFEEIAGDGSRVVVTGSGADELFLGYDKFLNAAFLESVKRGEISRAARLASRQDFSMADTLRRGASLLLPSGLKRRLRSYGILQRENSRYLKDSHPLPQLREAAPSLEREMLDHLYRDWYPHILRVSDKNASAYGLEVREGFLSVALLQKARSEDLLDNFAAGYRKNLLREAFQDILPVEIAERRDKTGFLPTDNRFMDDNTKNIMLEVLDSQTFCSREGINSEKVVRDLRKAKLGFDTAYRFYCYELWMREFID